MSDISQLTLPNGNSYSFKDLTARENISCIAYGQVDSTSTSTSFTATVDGITELKDGICVILQNGVVTSAAGFTVNINSLGAKKCYNNMTNATQDTTIFNINYTMLFIYSSALDSGEGGWWIYRGYNSNDNTIGYQLRTNSTTMPTISRTRYYRLLFTSADGTKWVPANTGYDNSATSKKTVNQNAIDPFGRIVYMSGTTNVNANANVGATVCWSRYTLNLGYSFNPAGGAAIVLTYPAPVYVKCAPQSNGSAIMDSTTPYVQALPSSADGKIYIFLGMAYSETNIELYDVHPVYWHDGTAIRVWTGKAIPTKTSELTNDSGFITNAGVTSFNGSTGAITYTAPVTSVNGSTGAVTVNVPSPGTGSSYPAMDGTRNLGSSDGYARVDHVHPTDTSRAASTHSHAISDVTDLQTTLNGKAASSHEHSGTDITSGTVGFSYLPTGTGASQVAIGNHSHSGYADSGHAHGNITNGGDITATAPTVASGDKLIINDESESKVTNGPSFGTSTTTYLRNDGTWGTPAGTYSHPTATAQTAAAKKVGNDGLGHVVLGGSITASDVGAAASSHNHAASDINSGTLDIAQIPTGSTASTVALGNHTHSGYAPSSHNHSGSDINSGTVGFSYLPTGTGASQVAVGNHSHSEYAPSSHTHTSTEISIDTDPMSEDVTTYFNNWGTDGADNVSLALNALYDGIDAKADSSHTHVEADITDLGSYLPLSGGTLTGDLTMDDSTIEIEDSNIDIGVVPSSAVYDRVLRVVDRNGDLVGYLQATQTSSGSHYNCFGASNSNDSYQNQIMFGWDINNNPKISVSYPDTFRDAIGATNGIFPRSLGGTGISDTGYYNTTNNGSDSTAAAASTWYQACTLTIPAGCGIIIARLALTTGSTAGYAYVYLTTQTLDEVKTNPPDYNTTSLNLRIIRGTGASEHKDVIMVGAYNNESATLYRLLWKSISTSTVYRTGTIRYLKLADSYATS